MSSIQVPIAKRRGSHAAHLLALLAGATMLAGCVTTNQDVVVGPTPTRWRSCWRFLGGAVVTVPSWSHG